MDLLMTTKRKYVKMNLSLHITDGTMNNSLPILCKNYLDYLYGICFYEKDVSVINFSESILKSILNELQNSIQLIFNNLYPIPSNSGFRIVIKDNDKIIIKSRPFFKLREEKYLRLEDNHDSKSVINELFGKELIDIISGHKEKILYPIVTQINENYLIKG
jgi:hypothetical protein